MGGARKIQHIRTRGGNMKHRALRISDGTFSWGSEAISRRTRVLDVVYNSTNNELVRTKTLVKGAICQIDATPFRQWWVQYYGGELGKKTEEAKEESKSAVAKKAARLTKSGPVAA